MTERKATIKCPHCGEPIVVRDASRSGDAKIWAAFDGVFKAVDVAFDKMDAAFRKLR